jgi:hypothetical protein
MSLHWHLTDDDRVYGFVRLETGDELSKRSKFALVTWVGPNVSALKKAKMSTDKSDVKQIISRCGAQRGHKRARRT